MTLREILIMLEQFLITELIVLALCVFGLVLTGRMWC